MAAQLFVLLYCQAKKQSLVERLREAEAWGKGIAFFPKMHYNREIEGYHQPNDFLRRAPALRIIFEHNEKGGIAVERLRPLLERYGRILVFDTETTGLRFSQDEIIQFSAALVTQCGGSVAITEEYDRLLALPEGKQVPPEITRLTGITTEEIREKGIPREQACREIGDLLAGDTLLCAYNAHFDLSFLYHLFATHADPGCLKGKDKLDLLTVYRDRRDYPHRLSSAIEAYGLQDRVRNSHRADQDTLATVYVMAAMAEERQDLLNYVNLFGYIPKYGPPRRPIRSVTYLPQPYHSLRPLYQTLPTQTVVG